jgi:hypothetical protein
VADIGPGWSAILGALVGVAGTGLTAWRIAIVTTRAEDRRQTAQHAHERELAVEERRQARLADSYANVAAQVSRTRNTFHYWEPGQPAPSTATADELVQHVTRALLFGSKQVEDDLQAWAQPTSRFLFVARELNTLTNRPERSRDQAWHEQWDSYVAEVLTLREQIARDSFAVMDQMRAELGSNQDSNDRGGDR